MLLVVIIIIIIIIIILIRTVEINCHGVPVIWHKILTTIKASLKAVRVLSDQPFSHNCSTSR